MQIPNERKKSNYCDFLQKDTGIGKIESAVLKFIKKTENFAVFHHKFFTLLLKNMGYNTIVTTKKTFFKKG